MNFKECSCGKSWRSRDAFLSDSKVDVVGYQVDFETLKEGFFLFNHVEGDCHTTLSVKAETFFDLYDGPVFKKRLLGTKECEGMCVHSGDIRRCPQECECAFVREVLRKVSEWSKDPAA